MMDAWKPSQYKIAYEKKVEEVIAFHNSLKTGTKGQKGHPDVSHKLRILQLEADEAHRRWFYHRHRRSDQDKAMEGMPEKNKCWHDEQMSQLDYLLRKAAEKMLAKFLPIAGTDVVEEKFHQQSCKICGVVVEDNEEDDALEVHMHQAHWMERRKKPAMMDAGESAKICACTSIN